MKIFSKKTNTNTEVSLEHIKLISACQEAGIPCEITCCHPIHNRIPLEQCKNLDNWKRGFDKGYPYYELGESARKSGDLARAEQLFDKARANGYLTPALYDSYAKLYRKRKDLDNEIAILDEGVRQIMCDTNSTMVMLSKISKLEAQKQRAIYKLMQQSINQIEE